jgi:predicted PhzF superfamily epimerase YddE/YHI9
MNDEIHVLDAFTTGAFRGNPAAVCILNEPGESDWMQQVAAEMGRSETAFVCRSAVGWDLRWFTPVAEVDLCGHATLAAAFVLWDTDRANDGETIVFHTRSGPLSARKGDDGITLDFPVVSVTRSEPPAGAESALGARVLFSGRTRFDLFFELPSSDDVCDLDPDTAALAAFPARGIIVTAGADMQGYYFVSRFFAPSAGINEDPVTGSAHCSLGPYWAEKLGKNHLSGFQCSERGGAVRVTVKGDRVLLGGDVVPVLSGRLRV